MSILHTANPHSRFHRTVYNKPPRQWTAPAVPVADSEGTASVSDHTLMLQQLQQGTNRERDGDGDDNRSNGGDGDEGNRGDRNGTGSNVDKDDENQEDGE